MANEKMKPQSPEEIARAAQEAALEQMRAMMGSMPGMPDMGDMQAQIMAHIIRYARERKNRKFFCLREKIFPRNRPQKL